MPGKDKAKKRKQQQQQEESKSAPQQQINTNVSRDLLTENELKKITQELHKKNIDDEKYERLIMQLYPMFLAIFSNPDGKVDLSDQYMSLIQQVSQPFHAFNCKVIESGEWDKWVFWLRSNDSDFKYADKKYPGAIQKIKYYGSKVGTDASLSGERAQLLQKIYKDEIGDKQEDNIQLMFMNEMLKFLLLKNSGFTKGDLEQLAKGAFDLNQVGKTNVINSDNIYKIRQNLENIFKTNKNAQAYFVKMTPLIQKGVIDRIRAQQQGKQQPTEVLEKSLNSTMSMEESKHLEEAISGSDLSESFRDVNRIQNWYVQDNPVLNPVSGILRKQKESTQEYLNIDQGSLRELNSFLQKYGAQNMQDINMQQQRDNYELTFLNTLAREARGLNWNFFARQTGVSRDQLMVMRRLPPNIQEIKDTIRLMMNNNRAEAEARQVVDLVVAQHRREQQLAREPLEYELNRSTHSMRNFGQAAGGNNGIIQPDHEILNEAGQNQQNVSNATSVTAPINNGVVPGVLDQSLFSMADAISHRLANRARYLGLSHEVINHLSQLSVRFRQAEAKSEPGADAAELRMELEAQNRLTIQTQNAPEVLAQVPNNNGIINYRDQQESDRTLSLTNIVNNESFNIVLDRLSSENNLTAQQNQLLHQSMTGNTLILNAIAQSNPSGLVRRESQVRNPFEESKGPAHSRSNIIQPRSSNSSMQSRASRRLNRTQQVNYLGYPELPDRSVRYPELPDRSVRYPELPNRSLSNPYTQRSQAISQVEDDESFIFGIPSQNESQSDISIIHPQFEGIGNPSRAEIESILNDLNSSLGLHLSSSDVLSSDIHLNLPLASDSQDPESNPFNNWFNQVFRGQNMPVNQQQPMLRNGIVVQRPALTAQNFATFLWQAAKFISEISGPIQDVILKTYQKQTKVYQIPIEKKETTSFKIRPGAAYKIRACE